MFIVTLVRSPSSIDTAVTSLVEILDLSLYEARTLLNAPTPRVLATRGDRDDADDLSAALSATGFSTKILDGRSVTVEHDADLVASLSLTPEAISATRRDCSERVLRNHEIRLLVRGMSTSLSITEHEETTRKLSVGKTLLTGGLMTHDKVTTKTTQTTRAHQGFLQVHTSDGGPPLYLFDQRMSYAFLGKDIQPASLANMDTLIAMLKQRAPHAAFDDRLMRAPNLGALPLAPRGIDPELWRTELAAALLASCL